MNRLKKVPMGIAAFFLALGMVFMPGTASANVLSGSTNTNSDLTELFILDRLFSDGDNGGLFNGDNGSGDLGQLFILERLFSGDGVLSGQRTVTVQSGDTLSGIAQTYLGDASRYPEIAAMNNISNPNQIFPGQVLTLPGSSTGTSVTGSSDLTELFILDRLFSDNNGDGLFNGDNDSTDMSTSTDQSADNNDGDNDLTRLFILERLFAGNDTGTTQTIVTQPETRTVTEPRTVTVRSGDTLSEIAQTHLGDASRYPEIVELNDIEDPDLIVPGQVLTLPGTTTRTITVGGSSTVVGTGNVGTSSDLTELFILDKLFSGSDNGDGLFGGDSDLGELFILERLFGNDAHSNVLGSGNSDLTELFILDELFSK